ncbi:hypothetical protein GCM10027517_22780 [Phycicoccus ginsengisoli]
MTLVQQHRQVDVTPYAGVPEGAPAGSVPGGADPAGQPSGSPHHHHPFVEHRRTAMFQALYADLARAHRTRREREYQRRLEARAQQEMLLALPRMLAR